MEGANRRAALGEYQIHDALLFSTASFFGGESERRGFKAELHGWMHNVGTTALEGVKESELC